MSCSNGCAGMESDMCKGCENVIKPGTVGKTYYDGDGNCCELFWFPDDPMPTLQVKSDGNWSCVMVPCCPICGCDLKEDS